jgi:hypothetical protein
VRVKACLLSSLVAGCGGLAEGDTAPWDPSGTTGGSSPATNPSDDDSTTNPDEGSGEEEDSSGGIDPDSGEAEESTGDPQMFDCAPQWTTPWIGSPCAGDGDCSYDGGFCVLESQGFPCGTCSQSCDSLCPDVEGAPETFCVDGSDVGLDAAGYCLSKCDPGIIDNGEGCRDGYGCAGLDRFNDSSTSAGVCVPQEFAGMGDTDCQSQLIEMGAVFTPIDHEPESPDGFPGLTCTIDDPVLLHSPVNGLGLRYIESAEDGEVLLGCETAISVVGSMAVADMLGASELIHYGTYNCRVIAGTSTLSEHGLGTAIDIAGFTIDGTEVTVLDDWEDGNPNPTTAFGMFLLAFTDAIWDMNLWNIILTPEYNAAHDNHFHVDLTPGGNTYSRP